MGARLALGLAALEPERFQSLWLVGVNPGLSDAASRDARRASDARWAARFRHEPLPAVLASWDAQAVLAQKRALPEAPEAELRQAEALRLRHSGPQLALALEGLGLAEMPDYRRELHRLRMPVHLVVGGADAKFLQIATSLCAIWPNAELHVAPGAGHRVPLEAPETLAAWVRESEA